VIDNNQAKIQNLNIYPTFAMAMQWSIPYCTVKLRLVCLFISI